MTTPIRTALLGLLTAGCLASSAACAQGTAKLTGAIESDTGEALAGAAVTVVHMPSGKRQFLAADGLGNFTVASALVGGPYTVQVAQAGFQPQVVTNIFLPADKPLQLTFILSRGARSRSIARP